MSRLVLTLMAFILGTAAMFAQPTSITLISPGKNVGEEYRAGSSNDITYDTAGTYRSRFRFQFGTSAAGPWTNLVGLTSVLDSAKRGVVSGGFRVPAVLTQTGYVRMVLLNPDGSLNEGVTSVSKNPFKTIQPPASKVDSVLSGSITLNTTLSRNKIYGLRGYVHVMAGTTITLEPGTIVFGDSVGVNSALIINRGAKIIANGRPDAPIVFTSSAPSGQRAAGDWL
ncbi:MAG: hypothetical protein HYZ54_14220 [Ignavibacteriae bacterium]|nr:hypothetical protein [Ignavibacteriota bacterium]